MGRLIPGWPAAWYVVCRSAELPAGGLRSGGLAGREFVLFRTEAGRLHALDAHCPHMGAHLQHGRVTGDRILCPLHNWTLDGDGVCRGPGAEDQRSTTWSVAEKFGLVFLYPQTPEGAAAPPPPPLPEPAEPETYGWITVTPIELDTTWQAMMVNGFDLLHLRAVHDRELIEPPRFERLDGDGGDRLRLHYVSKVAGGGLSDRVLKWLTKNRIQVRQTCYGPTIVVETDLGYTRTAAVFSLLQDGPKVRAFGAVGIRKPAPLLGLRLRMTRWLFMSFPAKDFAVIEHMKLITDGVADEGVKEVSAYLGGLPQAAGG